jgi:threonine/homoserine/homoserine lactone efflux protein
MDKNDPSLNAPNALSRSHPLRVGLICLAILCNVVAPMTNWPQQVRLLGYAFVGVSMIILAVAYVQSGTDADDKQKRRSLAISGALFALIAIYLLATRSIA